MLTPGRIIKSLRTSILRKYDGIPVKLHYVYIAPHTNGYNGPGKAAETFEVVLFAIGRIMFLPIWLVYFARMQQRWGLLCASITLFSLYKQP